MTTLRAILAMTYLACPANAEPEAVARYGTGPTELHVQGAADIASFGPVMDAFAAAHPAYSVMLEQWNTNDLHAAASADCRDGDFDADLVVSSAVDLQVWLVNQGCAQPHVSALTAALPAGRNWRNELFGLTAEPAVIVYNRRLVPEAEAPTSRFQLLDLMRNPGKRYLGRIATYDIEKSGVGYLFAFTDSVQASTFGSLIEAMGANGAVATCCSAEIIAGVAEGRWLIAYNVLGSYALPQADRNPDLAIIAPEDYTLMLSRAGLIPRGAAHPQGAAALVDFLLSPAGQAELTRQRLIVTMGEAGDIQLRGQSTASMRPIELSPVLLLGLDRQKRDQFLAAWRAAFAPR